MRNPESVSSRSTSRHASFSSSLRAPTMSQPADGFYTTSLCGIPEHLAVQELAYRQGQRDHGNKRERIPSSPFARCFDYMWADSYRLGKSRGGTPKARPTGTVPTSQEDCAWPVLINPYTQDLEHPNGCVDEQWTYKICKGALDSMEDLVRLVCRRPKDWYKLVCDVPAPVQRPLMAFPDLEQRYKELKQAAREALAGNVPYGY